MVDISFKNVTKRYGEKKLALDGLDLDIRKGEFLTLIGPSGCGKTTVLKMINGLISPTEGSIFVKGKNIKEQDIIKLRRSIGYVIQQIGLFPHMNIEKNISYVLKIMGVEESKRRKRAEELIKLVELPLETLERYPRELSGGQQQRIGVVRALAADPPIVLMDEPFGATDELTRKILQDELLRIQSKVKKTIVFVTHDIEEAMKLGDRVALMNEGKLEGIDTPREMFLNPRTPFVREFFGINSFSSFINTTNILEAIDRDYSYIVFDKENDKMELKKRGNTSNIIPVVDGNRIYVGGVNSSQKDQYIPSTRYNSVIDSNRSTMEAIEILFKEGKAEVPVVDELGKYLGMFSVEKGFDRITDDLK